MTLADFKPWSFVPFEAEESQIWSIYDDNLARLVATFHDKKEAEMYLKWRNKKQEKARIKHEKAKAAAQDAAQAGFIGQVNLL